MTLREFAMWQAYYRVEPFGQARDDMRSAVSTAILAGMWSGKSITPEDCLLKFKDGTEQTQQEMETTLRTLTGL